MCEVLCEALGADEGCGLFEEGGSGLDVEGVGVGAEGRWEGGGLGGGEAGGIGEGHRTTVEGEMGGEA